MKNIFKTLILVLTVAGFTSTLAHASEGSKPAVTPRNDLDNWDDDVWADWGAQPGAGKTDEKADGKDGDSGPGSMPTTDANVASSTGGSIGSNGFGETSDKIRFRLVREGENDGPQGVRKYRPTYGKRRSL